MSSTKKLALPVPSGQQAVNVRYECEATMAPKDVRRWMKSPAKRAAARDWNIKADPRRGKIYFGHKPNLVVNVGVQRSADRLFSLSGPPTAVVRIGMDNGTTNPVAASVSSDVGGGSDTGSSTQTLRTFDATPTRTGQVVTAIGTFNDTTTAGIGAVGFAMKRLFLSAHTSNVTNTTSSDASGSLYSETNVFTVDFTSITTWTLVVSASVTFVGS